MATSSSEPSAPAPSPPSEGAAITSELLVPLVLCLVLLLSATAAGRVLKQEAHPWHRHLRAVRIAQCVLSWYLTSISFTLWNKFVLRYWRGTGFPFPIFVTLLHMSTKLAITRLINTPCCVRPERKIKPLPCNEAVRGPVPIGVCTALDVAFSNLSFLFISVAFYTILKATAIVWILAWASLFGLEALTWEVLAICGLVSTGVALASYGEAAFSWAGFFLVTAACALSGLRWALTQTMLEGKRRGSVDGSGGQPQQQHRHEELLSTSGSDSPLRRQRGVRGVSGSGGGVDDGDGGRGGRQLQQQGQQGQDGAIGREEGEEEVEVEVELCDPTSSLSSVGAAPAAAPAAAPYVHHYAPPSSGGQAGAATSPLDHPSPAGHLHRLGGNGHGSSISSRGEGGQQQHHHRPLEVLYHISPASALSCLPVFLLFEAPRIWRSPFLANPSLTLELLLMLVLGGAFSFLLILAEVKLVKISSSLTMSMFGAVKEVITVALSMLAFHDRVTPLNVAGLVLAISGAVWYRSYKLRTLPVVTGGDAPGWDPSRYLPAASGIFNLEDSEDEEEAEEEEDEGGGEGGRRRGGAAGGGWGGDRFAELELRAVGRGRDVGLA